MKNKILVIFFTIIFVVPIITGCPNPEPITSTTPSMSVQIISGKVLVPPVSRTQLSFNIFQRIKDILIKPVLALSGLVPIEAGVEVRLIRIDDEGNQYGSLPIATAKTNDEGKYTITVPTTVNIPASDMVLEVGNYKIGSYMRAFVTKEKIDITPVTTAVVKLLVDKNEPLSAFVPTKLNEILVQADTYFANKNVSVDKTLSIIISEFYDELKSDENINKKIQEAFSTEITGRVLAPSGKLALRKESLGNRIANLFIQEALASFPAGLSPIGSGYEVRLSRIDDNGSETKLASTQTKTDGYYNIPLPQGVTPSSDLIVSVGSGESKMRSFVFSTITLYISPISEVTVQMILKNGEIFGQENVPLSQFSNNNIGKIQASIMDAVSSISFSGIQNIAESINTIKSVISSNQTVKQNIKDAIGIPMPTVDKSVPQYTNQLSVRINGTKMPGTLVSITGGIQNVSQEDNDTNKNSTTYSLDVNLRKNMINKLTLISIMKDPNDSSKSIYSAPKVFEIYNDTQKPGIDTSKISSTNPDSITSKTKITGIAGAITELDSKNVSLVNIKIENSRTGDSTIIKSEKDGSFNATIIASIGDLIQISADDAAGNVNSANIIIGSKGPKIVSLQPTHIEPDKLITIIGEGFSPILENNEITFSGIGVKPWTVDPNGQVITATVPKNMSVESLVDLPKDINVIVKVKNSSSGDSIISNDNKFFKLIPVVTKLKLTLDGNGESQYLHTYNYEGKNRILGTVQNGYKSKIVEITNYNNINLATMNQDITSNLKTPHTSIFRDIYVDKNNNLFTSNFDSSTVGDPVFSSPYRPINRVSKYKIKNGMLDTLLDESGDLGGVPGSIAVNDYYVYVAIPNKGIIWKLPVNKLNPDDFTSNPERYIFKSNLPGPIKDLVFNTNSDPAKDKKVLYISTEENGSISILKAFLDQYGSFGAIEYLIRNLGTGTGRLAIDENNNLFISLKSGVDIISSDGKRKNLVPSFEGNNTILGLTLADPKDAKNLYVNELGTGIIYQVSTAQTSTMITSESTSTPTPTPTPTPSNVITTVAGGGLYIYNDIEATNFKLNSPESVFVDSNENIYIVEPGNHRILKVYKDTRKIEIIVGNIEGSSGYNNNVNATSKAVLNNPTDVAVDKSGNIYIADRNNNRIRKVSNSIITTIAGEDSGASKAGTTYSSNEMPIYKPTSVWVDSNGENVYFTESDNNIIRKLVVSEKKVYTIAGGGFDDLEEGKIAVNVKLRNPRNVVVNNVGEIYFIVDSIDNSHEVYKVTVNGILKKVAGNISSDGVKLGGKALDSKFINIGGIALDSSNNLYISDSIACLVYKVNNSNGIISKVAGSICGFSGDNNEATNASLNFPKKIYIDQNGYLYIADTGNNRIRKVVNP